MGNEQSSPSPTAVGIQRRVVDLSTWASDPRGAEATGGGSHVVCELGEVIDASELSDDAMILSIKP